MNADKSANIYQVINLPIQIARLKICLSANTPHGTLRRHELTLSQDKESLHISKILLFKALLGPVYMSEGAPRG